MALEPTQTKHYKTVTVVETTVTEYPETRTLYVTEDNKRYSSKYNVPDGEQYSEHTEQTGKMLEEKVDEKIYEQVFPADMDVQDLATHLNA